MSLNPRSGPQLRSSFRCYRGEDHRRRDIVPGVLLRGRVKSRRPSIMLDFPPLFLTDAVRLDQSGD